MTTETIYSLFSSAVSSGPDRPFLWSEGQTVTYRQANERIDKVATFLTHRDVTASDRVGILSSNTLEFVYLLIATAKIGATFVPFDYRQEGEVLEYLLKDADPALLVVGQEADDAFTDISKGVDIDDTYTLQAKSTASSHSLRKAVDNTEIDSSINREVSPSDVAIINYTSGSTGPPKGVQNPHRAFVEAGNRIAAHCRTNANDRALIVLPLFHANPQTYALMHMLAVGGSLAIMKQFSASGFWPTARASDSTFFTHVGSVLEILRRTIAEGDVNTESSLRFTLGGAAQFENQERFETKTGIQIVRLYGLSEVGAGLVTMNPFREGTVNGNDHQGSIDRQPFDVKILNSAGTGFLDAGERGEIVIRPDKPGTMFAGYLGKHGETVDCWRDLWMHTGDLGWIDEDSNLHYVGRLKTSIRKKGENISPWEIETAVTGFDSVTEAVAIGVNDPVAGEEIKLYVVPSSAEISAERVHARCHEELPSHLVPRYVEIVSELPRTSTQKIRRMSLKERGIGNAWDSRER